MFFGKKKQEGPSAPPPPSADDAEKKDYVLRELSKLYTKVFRPIEEATKFDVFYSSLLNEAEFRTPPMVLLVGPYSVGKTTFIEYFVQCPSSSKLQFGVSRGFCGVLLSGHGPVHLTAMVSEFGPLRGVRAGISSAASSRGKGSAPSRRRTGSRRSCTGKMIVLYLEMP